MTGFLLQSKNVTVWKFQYLSLSVEKFYKKRSRFLRENQHFFREINVFTKVTKELISRISYEYTFRTVWKFQKFSTTAKIFRQIDLQYNSLVKYLI